MQLRDKLKTRLNAKTLSEACERLVDLVVGPMRASVKADVYALASLLDVGIASVEDVPFEGKYTCDPNGEMITFRSGMHPTRLQFTIAHELGHCLLRRFAQKDDLAERFRGVPVTSTIRKEEEVIANALAAEILMPRRIVLARLQYESVSWELVTSLQNRFGTSRQAMIRRLADVSNVSFVYASVMPRLFRDLHSLMAIDQFFLAEPERGARTERDGVFIKQRLPFDTLISCRNITLGIAAGRQLLFGQFSVRHFSKPIPTAKLIGAVSARQLVSSCTPLPSADF